MNQELLSTPIPSEQTCPRCLLNIRLYQDEIDRLKALLQMKEQAYTTDFAVASDLTPEQLRAMWNVIPGVKRCRTLVGPSLKTVKARLREYPKKGWWLEYFNMISRSAFLTGATTNWAATLVWACGPKNLSKVLAGDYTEQPSTNRPQAHRFQDEAILAWAKLRKAGNAIRGYSQHALTDHLIKSCFEAMGGEARGPYIKPFGSWPEHQESQKRREFIELYQAKAKLMSDTLVLQANVKDITDYSPFEKALTKPGVVRQIMPPPSTQESRDEETHPAT